MNKRDNPYTPGAGRKPRTLAGRDEELEAFVSLVERLGAGTYERSPIYTGLRSLGSPPGPILTSQLKWWYSLVSVQIWRGSSGRLYAPIRPISRGVLHERARIGQLHAVARARIRSDGCPWPVTVRGATEGVSFRPARLRAAGSRCPALNPSKARLRKRFPGTRRIPSPRGRRDSYTNKGG